MYQVYVEARTQLQEEIGRVKGESHDQMIAGIDQDQCVGRRKTVSHHPWRRRSAKRLYADLVTRPPRAWMAYPAGRLLWP